VEDDLHGGKGALQVVPDDLRPLVKARRVALQARLQSNGVFYSTSSAHVGNSLIYFYPDGNKASSPIPGSIKHIFTFNGEVALAIQRQIPLLPEDGIIDPFSQYPHFPARLYRSLVSDNLEEVKVEWIIGHFARWNPSPDTAVVLTLTKVIFPFFPPPMANA
jgi:hypothetical protein